MANVNRPTDTAVKEKDVNQKLQLYGIFTAFSNGKVPSNKQIDVALNSALASRALSSPSKKLSEEGRGLVADLKEVITQAKYLLLSKNDGNLLQDFIWDAQNLDGGSASLPGAPTDKETARQQGNEALEGLKTLGTLILSNGQFRKLLNDATVLARDMAGDAAQNAANKVNPSEDQLKQIDQPAEDDTWHDVPDLSRENIRGQVKSTYDKNKPFSREEARQAVQDGADQAQQQPTRDNQEAARTGVSTAAQNLKEQARQNVPDETQENAKKAKDAAKQNTKNYLNKKMPQERRDQTIWRLKKMVVEIQGHSDYQQAIDTLLNLAETYGGHADKLTSEGAGTVKGAHDDNSLRSAETNLKTLIERFANSTSTDDLFEALDNIYKDADQDPELKGWFKDLNRFIRKSLKEQGYILRDESNREWDDLYDRGQFLLRERYRDHTDRVLDELKFLGDQFDQDPQNRAFAESVQKLFNDLGKDENGNAQFKPHLITDLTDVIIPAIFENTRYVPIPRIEVSDPNVDVIVENLVLESDNLFPNVLEFGTDNYFRMGRRQASSKAEYKLMVAASGIQMDLRDVAYYLKKKQGFPSITDKGVMDIILAGEGFSFKLAARTAKKSDRTNFFTVDTVDVTVHDLNVKIKQSNHKLLFRIAKSLVLKVMKPVIQKVLEKQIKDNFEKADGYLYSIHQEAQKAAEYAKKHPEEAQNMYQNYVNAFQRKIGEKKKKAKEVQSNVKVNVAVTQEDSMFKHISLPGGISTKATEYKQLAEKGDRWESPIFGIGSAKESSDIPKLNPVKRKPHSTAAGNIRGGNHPGSTSGASTLTGDTMTGNQGGYGSQRGSQGGYQGQPGGYSGQTGGYTGQSDPGYGQSGAGYSGQTGVGQSGAGYSTQSGAGSLGQSGSGLTGQSGAGSLGQSGAGLSGQSGGGQFGQSGLTSSSDRSGGLSGQSGSGFSSQGQTSGVPGSASYAGQPMTMPLGGTPGGMVHSAITQDTQQNQLGGEAAGFRQQVDQAFDPHKNLGAGGSTGPRF